MIGGAEQPEQPDPGSELDGSVIGGAEGGSEQPDPGSELDGSVIGRATRPGFGARWIADRGRRGKHRGKQPDPGSELDGSVIGGAEGRLGASRSPSMTLATVDPALSDGDLAQRERTRVRVRERRTHRGPGVVASPGRSA